MKNVLELFSTDRRLLETRGSLIIRQLCLHLNAERIFRTIAEILEKDDDLEFASMMVVKLNMILITSPELADFRRRLKNLESKVGLRDFAIVRSLTCRTVRCCFRRCTARGVTMPWRSLLCVYLRRRMSTPRTCCRSCKRDLQAASCKLTLSAELELTVSLLVQIDKLVMLIESPVFTSGWLL
jgi:vacuole morphology and inheritance protein 14